MQAVDGMADTSAMSMRLSAADRRAIAQRELDKLEGVSAIEALRRYGYEHDGGPGPHEERRVDEKSGLPYRLDISAQRVGAEVLLSVGVWPLPETVRAGGRLRVVKNILEGWSNAPAVRSKLLPDE